jgi:hypothetical protein
VPGSPEEFWPMSSGQAGSNFQFRSGHNRSLVDILQQLMQQATAERFA